MLIRTVVRVVKGHRMKGRVARMVFVQSFIPGTFLKVCSARY